MTKPGMPNAGLLRVRLVGRATVHQVRADQLQPDSRYDGYLLCAVPELIEAVAVCGKVKGYHWVEARDPDVEVCERCSKTPAGFTALEAVA